MKWREYKSSIGMILASVYLFSCIQRLATFVDEPPYYAETLLSSFLDLTVVGTILALMFIDIARPENGVYISLVFIFIGVLINALMLYFIGYLLTRLLVFIRKSIKWRDYKSKTGIVLASVYLLVFILNLVEFVAAAAVNLSHLSPVRPVLLILTLPVSLAVASIFFFLFINTPLDTPAGVSSGVLISFFVGGVINTIALYFLGYLLTKKFSLKKRFVSLKKALWKR